MDEQFSKQLSCLQRESLYFMHIPCSINVRVLHTSRLLTNLYLHCRVVRMSRKHIVGSIHRCDELNEEFATLVGLAKRFEAY